MSDQRRIDTMDGNEAVAHVAYRINEACAIYPITPSSPMAEHADQWTMKGVTNIWGQVPTIAEMQSEGGAAGAVHGALQAGALTTTFTASQGLLLMIPNMYKIAGELTPAVFHVAARSLACQGLSIFGDHSDVMAVRSTGFAMVASASVQEAHDMALVVQATSLKARLPFVHFFDGFRTSHEINRLELLADDDLRAMLDEQDVLDHWGRALNPDRPVMRGTAQNPDIYFQGRETVNPYYQHAPGLFRQMLERFAGLTGRRYDLFEYVGHPEAERIIISMGSGSETVACTAEYLSERGEPVGAIRVRLYRPFSGADLLAALPPSTRSVAVLDRTKEPGAGGEPLYLDVVNVLHEAAAADRLPMAALPRVVGGRYGLGSKEFTPAMVMGVFQALQADRPPNHFTVGINDDVSHSSLDYDPDFSIEADDMVRALFYGLGADGTVGANKNTVKILGEDPDRYAQAYFVYDSKKSGSQTVSHLRFGPKPIRAPYLIGSANFVACHQFNFVLHTEMLEKAATGAIFLLNSPFAAERTWSRLPAHVQQEIIDKRLRLFVIDALAVARKLGMGTRINTIMQTCFFAISGVLPADQAIQAIKDAIRKTYGAKGEEVVRKNFAAVDRALEALHEVPIPERVDSDIEIPPVVPARAPEFVRQVTAMMMAGRGDELPVSALPPDGTYPTATTAWEKRNISAFVPIWEPDLCIQCGNCSLVCPHGVIRAKFYHREALQDAPGSFRSTALEARGYPDIRYTLQVFTEDCTGCGLCVEACPVRSRTAAGRRAINMARKAVDPAEDRRSTAFFESLPDNDRARVDFSTVRGVQYLRPLFEFSGACAGCGETPYLKLLSQLFGDRLLVANATGCSSIYGGNLPTTPWSRNDEGRGPAWSNSLFEDNAEFGFGFRLAADQHLATARDLLIGLRDSLGQEMANAILEAPQTLESEIRAQRGRVAALKASLAGRQEPEARRLLALADHLVRRSVWLVGGDGWAYDIGYGGLDHVLASGRDVNILIMDTEVYSNTGGQMSKATPLGAVAKFAAGGKKVGKKDLALQAIAYGNVYVARVAMGANPQQTLLAFREAEAYPGTSIILAYSHCIAHGINMQKGLEQQKLAAESGYWPLIRYNPALAEAGGNPFMLDSLRPRTTFKDYAYRELRYRMLSHTDPEEAKRLLERADRAVKVHWAVYEEMATRDPSHYQPR